MHVNLVKKTNVEGEEEVRDPSLHAKCRSASVSLTPNPCHQYLFAPYSAFTVVSATWNLGTSLDPHVIELEAAVCQDICLSGEMLFVAHFVRC